MTPATIIGIILILALGVGAAYLLTRPTGALAPVGPYGAGAGGPTAQAEGAQYIGAVGQAIGSVLGGVGNLIGGLGQGGDANGNGAVDK